MSQPTAQISVHNAASKPRRVAVEPWADDYTLLPGGELVLVALGSESLAQIPWFGVVEWDDTTQVYCEDTEDCYAEQDGKRFQWGREVTQE